MRVFFVVSLLLAVIASAVSAAAVGKNLDPFAVLGLDNDADEAAIKKAFRQLSRKFHPDHNAGSKEAEDKYREVQEAFDLLTKHRAELEGGVFNTFDEYMRWKEDQEKKEGAGGGKKGKKGKKKKSNAASRLYTFERDGIVDLTERKDFDDALKDRSKPILLKLYARWCTHCHSMAPAFKKAAISLLDEHNVTVASVDCADNEKLCQREQVHGYPTIRLLLPRGGGFDGSVETFQQRGPSVEAEEIVDFVIGSLKNEVIAIKGPADFKKQVLHGITSYSAADKQREKQQRQESSNINNATTWLVNFSTDPAYCPPCGQMKVMFKHLAASRFGSAAGRPLLNMATVNCDSSRSLCQDQDIQFWPQLRLYTLKGAIKHYLSLHDSSKPNAPYRGVPLLVDPQQAMHFPPGAALDITAALLEALLPERAEAPPSLVAEKEGDAASASSSQGFHNDDL